MSFQTVGPYDPKERGPKLVVKDRGTSSLFASTERIAADHQQEPFEVSNVHAEVRQVIRCQTIQTDIVRCTWHAEENLTNGACHGCWHWSTTRQAEHKSSGRT